MALKINPVTRETIPRMLVGRYAGHSIDELPNSYLRWVITQDFPKAILEAAKKKLGGSAYNDLYLNVSRHALDMFSKRFSHLWTIHVKEKGDTADGIATFLVKLAQEAWDKGEDSTRKRHQDDGVMRDWMGIRFVFGVNPNFPDYKDVITVMIADK